VVLRNRIRVGSQELLVLTGHGALKRLSALLSAARVDRVGVVYDASLPPQHLAALRDALPARSATVWVEVPGSDAGAKRFDTVAEVLVQCETRLTRDSAILSFGGSTIGNLAGVCASLLFRGVRLLHVPTTVMAQADGCIGLKQAVNGVAGKNMYGAFHAPLAVLNEESFLATQDRPDVARGFAEIGKAAFVCGGPLYDLLLAEASPAHRWVLEQRNLSRAIHEAANLKMRHLSEDPREEGVLRLMDVGHVVAHALETASEGALHHGDAVAAGIRVEAAYARRVGLDVDATLEADIDTLFMKSIGISTRVVGGPDPDLVARAVAASNKRRRAGVELTVPLGVGRSLSVIADLDKLSHLLHDELAKV
jgi:3-dehydroquinate synthase